ncbi:MAG: alpha/beta hydrolase [Actinomycetota bacterium]
MRRATTALLAVCLATFAAFTASASPADPPPPTYPIEQFLDAFQNTERSLGDTDVGRYNFDAGFYGGVRRAAQRYPEHYGPGMDARHEAQVAVDSLTHNRPKLPYDHITDAGYPDLMPDWDHDGVFGDAGGYAPTDEGDFDADTDDARDTAYFLFPCYTDTDEWRVHHRFSSGGCDVDDSAAQPFAVGVAHELKVIDSRGLKLDATLWLPTSAFAGTGCPLYGTEAYGDDGAWVSCVSGSNLTTDHALPAIVFSGGFASRQEHYAWFAMRMVEEGYVVLTYDIAGQGESEGTFTESIGAGSREKACVLDGFCRDVQDVVRWFVGQTILPIADTEPRLDPRADPATNEANPVLPAIDLARIGIAGNSAGAIATLSYLDYLGGGAGIDGRPLPPVRAAVSLSGAQQTRAIVPIQFQTTDGDGSPAFVIPKVGGVNLGAQGQGIGYELIKERYDVVRASQDPAPLSLVVFESGTHTDHVDEPFVPRTNWANALAADYAADWLNCYVLGDAASCAGAVSVRPHLSHVYASEQDPDGPIGPSPSRCMTVPDAWSINRTPQDMIAGASGSPVYDCTP